MCNSSALIWLLFIKFELYLFFFFLFTVKITINLLILTSSVVCGVNSYHLVEDIILEEDFKIMDNESSNLHHYDEHIQKKKTIKKIKED